MRLLRVWIRAGAIFLAFVGAGLAAPVLRADIDAMGRLLHPGQVFPAPLREAGFVPVGWGAPGAPQPILIIAPQGEDGSDRRVEAMTWFVMQAVSDHLRRGVPIDALIPAIAAWAHAHALEQLEPAGPKLTLARSRYTLKRALLPLLAGYAVARREASVVSSETRSLIEGWLARLVRLAEPADGPTTARNNHRYMRDAVLIAWGALSGDEAAFTAGVDGLREAILAMRADGGWPLELARGPRALWYQRHALASLVAGAEIAIGQGVDLYAIEQGGRSLHRAVGFLLDGVDRAAADQDLGFLARRGNGRHYMAWAEAYLARFPKSANAARLRALLAAAPRPLVDDYSGGDVAALVGAVPEPALAQASVEGGL
jgi:poly(beta-D-mannuronate) lyase